MLRVLRPADEVEPAPGFYARVLDEIENQRPQSVWTAFLEPVFFKRLAYTSLTLLLLLGALVINSGTEQAAEEYYSYEPEVILSVEPVSPYIGDDIERDRDVILVNLATYEF